MITIINKSKYRFEADITSLINQDRMSKSKQQMKQAIDYYNGKHDILNYRMFYLDSDGRLVEDKTRSNYKIPYPFFNEIIEQKVSY